jgi:hypothetical protein
MKTFIDRLANEPVLIKSFVVAALNLFITSESDVEAWATVAATLAPLLLGFFVRSKVAGPKTAETLAHGTLQQQATPEQKTKARQVLGRSDYEGTVIPPELRRLAEQYAHLLPIPYPQIVAQGGLVALELAIQTAQKTVKRAPTSEEAANRYIDKAKAGQ